MALPLPTALNVATRFLARTNHKGEPEPAAFTIEPDDDGLKVAVAPRGFATSIELGSRAYGASGRWDKDLDDVKGKLNQARGFVPFADWIAS